MENKSKRFDRELFEQNDKLVRSRVREVMSNNSTFELRDNPKKLGVDIQVFHNNEHVCNIELERKKVWTGEFKYNTLQIPFRKKKYCELDKPTYFVVFNKDLDNYMVIYQDILVNSEVKEVPNKYVYSGELFFQVDISKVGFNNLQGELDEFLTKKKK